jgi:two-component system, OmpR family, KDP operon response regulator KdpE
VARRPVTKILVVDDDPALVKALRIGLTARGDEVATTHTGTDAITHVALYGPELVILDLGLPDLDGLEVCRRIGPFSNIPIVVLSAYGDEHRKVEALDGGADDFITKPFGMAELEARLRVAIRHSAARAGDAPLASATLHVGDLEIDMVHHMATKSGTALPLTSREFDLLAYLAHYAGKECTHHMISRTSGARGTERSPTMCACTSTACARKWTTTTVGCCAPFPASVTNSSPTLAAIDRRSSPSHVTSAVLS